MTQEIKDQLQLPFLMLLSIYRFVHSLLLPQTPAEPMSVSVDQLYKDSWEHMGGWNEE